MKAIAAMSLNRVIGRDGKLPWHLPEDFRWFKQMTTGQVILMGRKTFESFGKPLSNRRHVVLTRGAEIPGVETLHDLADFDEAAYAPQEVWVIGGEEVFKQTLSRCSDIYLTVVPRAVEGDAFFPPFEDKFKLVGTPLRTPDFEVQHYRRAKDE